MDPSTRLVSVRSFSDAQPLVPFPVHEVALAVERIEVCPASTERWATVRSEHTLRGARFAVKQYAMDWFGHFSAPNKLYSTKTGHWALYGPTTQLPVDRGTAFHGFDWQGREAASLATLGMHVEVRALEGALGPEGAEEALRGIRPLDPERAKELAPRPLAAGNWSLQPGHSVPGSSAASPAIRWTAIVDEAAREWGARVAPPALPGWSIDSLGVTGTHRAGNLRLLYRSADLHAVLEVVHAVGPTAHHWTGQRPSPPLFEAAVCGVPGVLAMTAAPLDWSIYTTRAGDRSLKVVVPPGRSTSEGDLPIVRDLVHRLLGAGW